MADDITGTYKLEKTITLNKLKPNEYRLWVVQTEATFDIHKCMGIVLGTELNPTPMDDDGTSLGPVGEIMQATITFWQTRHALVKEALLKCLEPADLTKVLPFRNTAAAIWTPLQEE